MKSLFHLLGFFPFILCFCDATELHQIELRKSFGGTFSMIAADQLLLREGDLVVRLNRSPSSSIIKYFNRHDKRFSHSGIVLFENGYPYIYHIIDGAENPDGNMRKDSLLRFCNPQKNSAYGIFRYSMTEAEIGKLKNLLHRWYAKKIRFDAAFSLASEDRMYCSEMVSKALAEATSKRIRIEPTKLSSLEASFLSAYAHLPYNYTKNLRIIAIDDLYTNPFCHLVKTNNFY